MPLSENSVQQNLTPIIVILQVKTFLFSQKPITKQKGKYK